METTFEITTGECTTGAIALTEVSLDQLAADIKREHEAAEGSIRASLLHAREAGMKLIEAKKLIPHGQWMAWVKEQCEFKSHSTALLYMSVAKNWYDVVGANSQSIENLTLYQAAKYLAAVKREVDAAVKRDAIAGRWDSDLSSTAKDLAVTRLGKELRTFAEHLKGGRMYFDMDLVLKHRREDGDAVDEQHRYVLDGFHRRALEGITFWFLECRQYVDRSIEALRRRLDDAPVAWEQHQTLLDCVEEETVATRTV